MQRQFRAQVFETLRIRSGRRPKPFDDGTGLVILTFGQQRLRQPDTRAVVTRTLLENLSIKRDGLVRVVGLQPLGALYHELYLRRRQTRQKLAYRFFRKRSGKLTSGPRRF